MLKLLILTVGPNDYTPQRIYKEANKLGIKATVAHYKNLSINIDKKIQINLLGKNILDYDMFVFRAVYNAQLEYDFSLHVSFLVKFLLNKKKLILNGKSILNYPEKFDKLIQHQVFSQNNIPHIPTLNFSQNGLKDLNYPVLCKPLNGSHSRDIFLLKKQSDYDSFVKNHQIANFLVQDYLDTGTVYRIIVIGEKVYGMLKKNKAESGAITSFGGKRSKIKLHKDFKKLALQSARIFHCDYAGIDIMYDNQDKACVLEVNRKAEIKVFEEYIGVNVAKELIKFLNK